jgi:hypothetical protein
VSDQLILRFSHNIVEHLGLKLYQNKPTRVIAELVSNSWDADANHVHVNMEMSAADRWVAVLDDGTGMTREALRQSYLVIGHPRRLSPTDRSPAGRPLMGRKGVGKLAPFGIARVMDVITAARVEPSAASRVHWLRFHLPKLLGRGDEEVLYMPDLVADGVTLDELPLNEDPTGQVTEWRQMVGTDGTGTIVLMSDLSLSRAIPQSGLLSSLGERFTIAIDRGIEVAVNGEKASSKNALPELEFRIPSSGVLQETIGGQEVRAWVGFVRSASWPQDQAGVGVYSHGKIAQDRPFTFGVKGKEIFSRYMFAVVEADWLDEQNEDLISTDRTSINWESPKTADLYRWGNEKVKEWIAEFEKWRASEDLGRNRQLVKDVVARGRAVPVTGPEEEEIARLVSDITPSFGKDEDAKVRLVKAISDAWVQKPMRRLIKDLWSAVGSSREQPPEHFTAMVERLSLHSVPESLNLAVVFAQRAFALTRLHDYVHHGTETNLQQLIERFPWIVEPDLAVLTANQQLRTAIAKAEELGQVPTGRRAIVGGVPDKNKPDFVFLSSPNEHQIVVVELKNPQEDLTIENRSQLIDYMTWFEAHYDSAEITGYLIGRRPKNLKSTDQRVEILAWTDILNRSRGRNLELLAAMLLATGGAAGPDARVADAIQLGGPEAAAMLEKLASEHDELRRLIDDFRPVAARDVAG